MIQNPIKFVYYSANGTNTDFSYAFNGTSGFDTKVTSEVKAAILNPDGTRDINPNFAVLQDAYGNLTGFIRFATAPIADAVVYIYRETQETQDIEYKTSSGFDGVDIEKSYDKLTKQAQEIDNHARNKTIQLDMFQETVLSLILTNSLNQDQMMYIDWSTLTIKFTSFKRGQVVTTPTSGEDEQALVMIRPYTDVTGAPILQYSVDQGVSWRSVLNGGAADIHNNLLDRDADDAHPMSAITGLVAALQAISDNVAQNTTDIETNSDNIAQNTSDIQDNTQRIEAIEGRGGALTYNDFGTVTPTQQALTQYACESIWGTGGVFTWNSGTPSASTYVINSVTHTALEIFNSTWVKNTNITDPVPANRDHIWQLVNTPDTGPAVFSWTDTGKNDSIATASSTYAGVIKKYSSTGSETDGTMDQKAITQAIINSVTYPKKYITGLNWVYVSTTSFKIETGECLDSTNAKLLTLSSDFTKTLSTFATGSGNGGLATGLTLAANTKYFVFLVNNGTNSDIMFDTSSTGANIPGTWTYKRFLTVFTTNASSQIIYNLQTSYGNKVDVNLSIDIDATIGTVTVSLANYIPYELSNNIIMLCQRVVALEATGNYTFYADSNIVYSCLWNSTVGGANGELANSYFLNPITVKKTTYNIVRTVTNAAGALSSAILQFTGFNFQR